MYKQFKPERDTIVKFAYLIVVLSYYLFIYVFIYFIFTVFLKVLTK